MAHFYELFKRFVRLILSEALNIFLHSSSDTLVHEIRQLQAYEAICCRPQACLTSVTGESALSVLMSFKDKWGAKYPAAVKSREDNWKSCPRFRISAAIRKIIYTTNIIEGPRRQFRKVTKAKAVFPTDDNRSAQNVVFGVE